MNLNQLQYQLDTDRETMRTTQMEQGTWLSSLDCNGLNQLLYQLIQRAHEEQGTWLSSLDCTIVNL